jgi:hypothetical protein
MRRSGAKRTGRRIAAKRFNALKRAIYTGPAQARRIDALSLVANIMMAWNTTQRQAVVGLLISIQGAAEVIRDKAQFEGQWQEALSRWFKEGVDAPGLNTIRVNYKSSSGICW